MVDNLDIVISKLEARKVQSDIRKKLAADNHEAAQIVCNSIDLILAKTNLQKPIVAIYNAIGAELDLIPLAEQLLKRDIKLCMPVVVEKGAALIFRQWQPTSEMAEDSFKIMVPSDTNEQIQPDIILVPLLAFDRTGYRLGYGGGFYDRTLAQLGNQIVSIGIAFAGQEMPNVPTGEFDTKLNYILTENEFIEIGN